MPARTIQILLLAGACWIGGCASVAKGRSPKAGAPPQIRVEDLNARPVVGRLGLPLGTAVEVEATVVPGNALRVKNYASRYLLSVSRVNGKPLPAARMMEFSVPSFVQVGLARDAFALYEMKTGRKAESLGLEQIGPLEQDYVGAKRRLVVYEVGAFEGTPRNLPPDVPTGADVGFGFTSSLVVLAERK